MTPQAKNKQSFEETLDDMANDMAETDDPNFGRPLDWEESEFDDDFGSEGDF